jgi:uncharacterized iron-regulated membrane protein
LSAAGIDSTMNSPERIAQPARTWPSYRTIWRWHFYAGLFCIPFVIWLSITGSIYLFRPQIEAWLERSYDHLQITGPRASGEAQVLAAIRAVPGSSLHYYEAPRAAQSAVRIVVGRGAEEFRVYVHPQTSNVMNVVNEDKRPMTVVFHLHGELLMGDRGSVIVELAASWAIVMILTGLYLWWPGQARRLQGVLYPRFSHGRRIFWRDLHAVTGVWISCFVLFLLFTGLPWASSWGKYLERIRYLTNTAGNPDWTTGPSSEAAARAARNTSGAPAIPGEHAGHAAQLNGNGPAGISFAVMDRIVATVSPLHLAYPVLISPPTKMGGPWTAKSDAQNRTLRVDLELDPMTGAVIKREDFNQCQWIDQAVGIGVAAHEGQLFGLLNQLLGVFTAMGLILLCISSVVLWWRRRPESVLGAPPLLTSKEKLSGAFIAIVAVLALYLPLLGVSIIAVLLIEFVLLRRIPAARYWLGLQPI